LLGAESKLQLHSGKQFKNFSVKDLENYLSDRAKRGLMLPQGYRKVDRVIEVFDVSEDS
jgi:topoisomerase-4 subunit A